MDLLGIVGPGSLTPVAKTTGFQQQHMEKGLLIRLGARNGGIFNNALVKRPMKRRAQLVHGAQHIGVPLDPAQVVGPRRAFHAEAGIGDTQPGYRVLNLLSRGVVPSFRPETLLLYTEAVAS